MIDPAVLANPGTLGGVYSNIANLNRRLQTLESARGYINGLNGGVIAPGTITGSQIASGTIVSANIQAGAITAALIQAGAITTGHIQADAITTALIAAGAITATEIGANVINAGHIQSGSLTSTTIGAGAITTEKLAAGAVTSDKITVTALSAITTNAGAITAGTITGATLQTATTGSRVVMDSAGLRGYALNGTTKVFEINAGSGIASFTGVATLDGSSVIPGGAVTVGTLPGDRIVSASVNTLQLAAGAVVANTIAAGAVTAQKISVIWGGANMLLDSGFAIAGLPLWIGSNATISSVLGQQRVSSPSTRVARLQAVAGGTAAITLPMTTSTPTTYAEATYASTYGGVAGGAVSGLVPAEPTKIYTLSAYFKAAATARNCDIKVEWYSAAGGLLATVTSAAVASVTSGYTRVTTTVTAPASTAALRPFFQIAGVSASEIHYVADAQLEPGEIGMAYSRYPGEILPGEVGNTQIGPDSITTNHIAAGSIQGGDISASTITGTNIEGSTITADKINVTTLSAITANMGTITAGTITGATIRTSASTSVARVVLDASGIRQYGTNGSDINVNIPSDGSNPYFFGTIDAAGLNFHDTADTFRFIKWYDPTGVSIATMLANSIAAGNQHSLTLDSRTLTGSQMATMTLTSIVNNNSLKGGRAELRAYNGLQTPVIGSPRFVATTTDFNDMTFVTETSNDNIFQLEAIGHNFKYSDIDPGKFWINTRMIIAGDAYWQAEDATDRAIAISQGRTYGMVIRPSQYGVYAQGATYCFYAAGPGANYGPFTGAHNVRVKGNVSDYLPGMIVSSTGDVSKRAHHETEFDLSTTLPQIELATASTAKAVFGVYMAELNEGTKITDAYYDPEEGERLAIVNGLGEGLVYVCDFNGEIENGDFITASDLPGLGQKQNDNRLLNSTVAKATESSDFASEPVAFLYDGNPIKAKLIACTYHCS